MVKGFKDENIINNKLFYQITSFGVGGQKGIEVTYVEQETLG